MKFVCPLIVVRDIAVSRAFYEGVLGQNVGYDLGENVSFEGGFAIHLRSHFADLVGVDEGDILKRSNNAELYFCGVERAELEHRRCEWQSVRAPSVRGEVIAAPLRPFTFTPRGAA